MEADASKLAGASGLVEVNVKATPNEEAKAYYKNNMVLTVLVPVDMEKCYSVDAPGAQVQSVGSYQAAMFAALPGEDGDFTVRVGTDKYENIGVIMMMVPGTLDELNRIKDLKEAKDTWREDGNKMYDSMNALLKTMESMKSDVSGVKGGLANLDQARGTVSANRKQIEALSTQALADLQAVTDQTTVMIPYLQTARDAVTDINSNTQALSNTMEDMQDELDRLYDRLGSLSKSLRSASDELNKGLVSQQTQDAIEKDIVQRTAEVQKILEELDKLLGQGNTSLAVTEQGIGSLNQSLVTLDGMKLKRIRKMKSAEKEETSVSSEAASGNGNGQTAGRLAAQISRILQVPPIMQKLRVLQIPRMTRKWQQALRPLAQQEQKVKIRLNRKQRAQAQRLVQLVTRRKKRLNQRQRRKRRILLRRQTRQRRILLRIRVPLRKTTPRVRMQR